MELEGHMACSKSWGFGAGGELARPGNGLWRGWCQRPESWLKNRNQSKLDQGLSPEATGIILIRPVFWVITWPILLHIIHRNFKPTFPGLIQVSQVPWSLPDHPATVISLLYTVVNKTAHSYWALHSCYQHILPSQQSMRKALLFPSYRWYHFRKIK